MIAAQQIQRSRRTTVLRVRGRIRVVKVLPDLVPSDQCWSSVRSPTIP